MLAACHVVRTLAADALKLFAQQQCAAVACCSWTPTTGSTKRLRCVITGAWAWSWTSSGGLGHTPVAPSTPSGLPLVVRSGRASDFWHAAASLQPHALNCALILLLDCSINESCGGGLVFWHPKGAMVSLWLHTTCFLGLEKGRYCWSVSCAQGQGAVFQPQAHSLHAGAPPHRGLLEEHAFAARLPAAVHAAYCQGRARGALASLALVACPRVHAAGLTLGWLGTAGAGQVDLWKTSGHFDFYRESMFNQMDVDAEEYQACALGSIGSWGTCWRSAPRLSRGAARPALPLPVCAPS